jgi:hypothetical protein
VAVVAEYKGFGPWRVSGQTCLRCCT